MKFKICSHKGLHMMYNMRVEGKFRRARLSVIFRLRIMPKERIISLD